MLTPADIDSKQFSTTRLKEGYDQNEVDTFLDRVQEDYAFALQQLKKLESDNTALRRQADRQETVVLPKVEAPSAAAEKLLSLAEQAVAEQKSEAQAEADRVVREAGGRAARVIEEASDAAAKIEKTAQEEAERIRNEGYADKYRKFEELERRHSQLQSAHDGLKTRADQVRKALTEAVSTYDREAPQ